jgi:hypothetical protein
MVVDCDDRRCLIHVLDMLSHRAVTTKETEGMTLDSSECR